MKVGHVYAGRYRAEALVGQGGMQDVYRAHDQLLQSEVALKTPQPGQATKRFRQSAVYAARVNHHNVAKTLDCFDEDGEEFLVEEFVHGENLEVKLSRYRVIDPHMAARILHHMAKGIAASHHAGVIHRDLKPSNVMVSPGPNLHELKITDFGIATLTEAVFAEAEKGGDITQSASGTIRGALPYMAPEMMFRGDNIPRGSAMDIWSLGAMMFRLMAGEYPFGVYLDAVANVKTRNRAQWPAFTVSNPQFKPLALQLQALIDRCLDYDPAVRPTADALATSCIDLCYITDDREEGQIAKFIQNGYSAFINGPRGDVFCSMESVYGPRFPDLEKNRTVIYSRFPGTPAPRGHPIVVVG